MPLKRRTSELKAIALLFFANARPPSALAKCITEYDASRIKRRIYNRYLSFTTHLMSRGRRTYLLLSILSTQSRFQPSRYVKSLLPSPFSVPSPFHGRNERHYPRKFRSLADKNEQNVWARAIALRKKRVALSVRNYVARLDDAFSLIKKIFHNTCTVQAVMSTCKASGFTVSTHTHIQVLISLFHTHELALKTLSTK